MQDMTMDELDMMDGELLAGLYGQAVRNFEEARAAYADRAAGLGPMDVLEMDRALRMEHAVLLRTAARVKTLRFALSMKTGMACA